MPLLDHFDAPQVPWRSWESFYVFWAVSIADTLNRVLPQRYVADIQPRRARHVEEDLEERRQEADVEDAPDHIVTSGLAVPPGSPPVAAMLMPLVFPDDFEVHVIDRQDDARLVAVVGLAGPRNKELVQSRRGFAAKSVAYLQRGVGLIIVDIVTSLLGNLHNEVIEVLSLGEEFKLPAAGALYAVAYRPTRRQGRNEVDVWTAPLAVGSPLPVLPLALRGSRAVALDLEAVYSDARWRSRL
jgi:hypothetical protein